MSTKYRIYCTEPGDEGWQEVWSNTPPTTCPNNAEHSVNANSVQELDVSTELLRINNSKNGSSTNFMRILKFNYNPASVGIIRRCNALVYKDGTMTNFTIQIFDVTNQNEMLNIDISNELEENLVDLGLLTNVPTSQAVIEVSIKRNGGNYKSNFYLDEIIFYS